MYKIPLQQSQVLRNEQADVLWCRVGIHLSHVEVRFQDLNIETDVLVGSRGLPSVSNAFLNYVQVSRQSSVVSLLVSCATLDSFV